MRMILIVLAIVAAVFGGLAAFTAFGVRGIERAHPPAGRFVEVDGGRLHLLELGPADAPPSCCCTAPAAISRTCASRSATGLRQRYRVILVDRPGTAGAIGRAAAPTPRPPVRRR